MYWVIGRVLRRLGRVGVSHEIALSKAILSIHIIRRTLTLVDRLREGGGRSGIGAIVNSCRIECPLVVPEIQVETAIIVVVVGVHDESSLLWGEKQE